MTNEYASPEDRIRLAEFVDRCHEYVASGMDEDGQACQNCGCGPHDDYDPLNNHTDCHALIEALRADDKPVALYFGKLHRVSLYVETGKFRHESWSGDDYRTGVVTLALEVLSDE